jgi:hypothetical protein
MSIEKGARVVATPLNFDDTEASLERVRPIRFEARSLWVLLLVGAACSEAPIVPTDQGAGGALPAVGGGGGSGTPGGASAQAGASSAAGSLAAIGGGGTGAGGQPSGSVGGAAGMQSIGGGGGNAGSAGSAGGSAAGGAAGGANDPAADVAAFATLNGYQLLDPCDLTNYTVTSDPGAVCPQKDNVKNQHLTLHVAGDASVTYVVKLHVRGILEGYWYDGGSLDPVGRAFYTGGVPTVGGNASACKNMASSLPFMLPSELAPTDGCFNGFNMFAMSVSAPKQHYYLNYTAEKDGDRPPHAVYKQDYTVSVDIQGQAALDFFIVGSDEHQCYNHNQTITGVALPMSPYIGEFLQFDVVSVTRK